MTDCFFVFFYQNFVTENYGCILYRSAYYTRMITGGKMRSNTFLVNCTNSGVKNANYTGRTKRNKNKKKKQSKSKFKQTHEAQPLVPHPLLDILFEHSQNVLHLPGME